MVERTGFLQNSSRRVLHQSLRAAENIVCALLGSSKQFFDSLFSLPYILVSYFLYERILKALKKIKILAFKLSCCHPSEYGYAIMRDTANTTDRSTAFCARAKNSTSQPTTTDT